ncbi:THAP domain-containing protein 5 [Pelobates fuscus]|uniref:THAP domain-containing protein 5 n=1 Tax=Pelobates fuscus TaxID=191477 RepID=UPI002FE49CD2
MTRYCAAPGCKNRGGQAAAGKQQRVSFYPFPLHDKGRLQQWLWNMKQSKWYPTKHQVLCSDHFTADCFNIRWGIRYLKPNAVPTIFPCASSFQSENTKEGKEECMNTVEDTSSEIIEFCPLEEKSLLTPILTSDESCIKPLHTKYIINRDLLMDQSKELLCQESNKDTNIPVCQQISLEEHSGFISTVPSLNLGLHTTNKHHSTGEQDDGETENYSGCHTDHFRDQQTSFQEHEAFKTIELTSPKQSVITIILPEGNFEKKPIFIESLIPNDHSYTDMQQFDLGNAHGVDSDCAYEVLENEHSYCRQEFNRNQIWEKITKLKCKIALLEVQEHATLSRLQVLETLIRQLKQENLLSDEKLQLVENCCNNFEIAIVQ